MAESSLMWTTVASLPTGDQRLNANGYTQVDSSLMHRILAACGGFEGIAPGYLNGLWPSSSGGNVQISTGGAVVDGKMYYNPSLLNVAIPAAVGVGNTRYDMVVLRCSWAGFTVRATRIAGTDAVSPVIPGITQNSGVTYDIPICIVLVNTSGTLTVTDWRQFAGGLSARQGGDATDWNVPGATNYLTPGMVMQCGCHTTSTGGSVTVTFPIMYKLEYPLVFLQLAGARPQISVYVVSNDRGTATIKAKNTATGVDAVGVMFFWFAIGRP